MAKGHERAIGGMARRTTAIGSRTFLVAFVLGLGVPGVTLARAVGDGPASFDASVAVAARAIVSEAVAGVENAGAENGSGKDASVGGTNSDNAGMVRVRTSRNFPTAGSNHELRPLFGTLDGALFRERVVIASDDRPLVPLSLAGIGFPHVEIVLELRRPNRRRFVRLLDWHTEQGNRGPLARVRCMNLPSHVVARRAARYAPTIDRLAVEHGLAPSLVMAVVARESCFDPEARSSAGAIGLMQLMPATARELRAGNVAKPLNNIRAGVRYLAAMRAQFGSVELALAAYNAGPGNVRRHGGIPPFAETRAYVERVLAYERRYRAVELVASL